MGHPFEEPTPIQNLQKRLYDKMFHWWGYLSDTGDIIILFKDGRWKIVNMRKWSEYGSNPQVKKIIWTSTSTDTLYYFSWHVLSVLPLQVIQKLLNTNSKDNIDILLKHHNKLFYKYEFQSPKDYMFGGSDEENIDKGTSDPF